MAGNIFINYRRDESGHVAGRLHDSLAPKFGRNKLFMDVDNIPVGRDFEEYLKSQVAACDAMLAVIGPDWLTAKDETGQRRLDNPEDFVVVEIAAALARNIPVVPVLVGGARMPKASELPDSLKPLARRQAFQIRHTNFRGDSDALVNRLREALGDSASGGRWRVRTIIGVTAAVVLLLIGVGGYAFVRNFAERGVHQAELKWEQERSAAMAEANRKVEEAEQQRVKAEQERQRLAAEAEAKRKADEAERQRLAGLKAEQERQARAAAEAAEAKRKAEEAERQRQAEAAVKAEQGQWRALTDRTLCGNALNNEKSGWDQTPRYGTYVTEASRRGLTVDSCRQLVGATAALSTTTASNSLFTVQRGMEASRALGYPQVDAFYSPSIGECEQKCAQQSNCNVFTYNKRSSGACYLYTRADLKPNPEFDTGTRDSVNQTAYTSSTTPSNSLFTIRRGVEASSAQAGETFYSQSIEDCEQKCAQQPICNVYTYKKSNFRCYLYPRADLGPNADFDSGVRK